LAWHHVPRDVDRAKNLSGRFTPASFNIPGRSAGCACRFH
jgi:hypothetical protein